MARIQKSGQSLLIIISSKEAFPPFDAGVETVLLRDYMEMMPNALSTELISMIMTNSGQT